MIEDLHSHTYYSFCGHDSPDAIIEAAIYGGINIFGICDHNYGIAQQRSTTIYNDSLRRVKDYQRSLNTYLDHIRQVASRYQDQIRILCGIEVATIYDHNRDLPDSVDLSKFDFCLLESIDSENTAANDIFAFAQRYSTKYTGIAHTDLFSYLERTNQDPFVFFSKMAKDNIFWEMNVNYDSTHHYRFHQYVHDFFQSEYQQEIIRKSGVMLSVGFDGHRVEDYRPDIIHDYCSRIQALDIPIVFLDAP